MPVETRVFGQQQSAHKQRRNVVQGDEVRGWERAVDRAVWPGSLIGAEDEIAAQARDRRRHLAWRFEVDLLSHRERRRVRRTSPDTHVNGDRTQITVATGRYPQAFGHREPGCAQQLREVQMLHAEREIYSRI